LSTGKRFGIAGAGVAVGCAVIVGVALLGFLCLGAFFYFLISAGDARQDVDPEGVKASVVRCFSNDGSSYEATVTITNNTESARSITVTVEWLDTDDIVVNDLAAGQSRTEEARAADVRSARLLRCRDHVR